MLVRILLGPAPWLHLLLSSARRFVRRLHCYYGRVRLLWSVHRRLRPPAFPARSLQNSARTAQRYPGSRAEGVCACQCLRRRGADLCLAIATWAVSPSAGRKASAPRSWFSPLNGWPTLSPVNASLRPSRVAAHDSGSVRFATPSPKRTHMGVFGSSGQVHRHIKKLRWLFRYPRSEPYFMTWLVRTRSNSHPVAAQSSCTNIPRSADGAQEVETILSLGCLSQSSARFRSPGSVRTG